MTHRPAVMISVAGLCVACAAGSTRAEPGRDRAVLEAYVQAWNRHDSTAFDTLLASDGVHEDLAQGFVGHGPAEVRAFMAELIKLEPDFEWRLTRIIAVGHVLAAEWTWTATYTGESPRGPVVGRHLSGRGASIVDIEQGRIKRFTDYYDNASFFPRAS